MRQPLAADALRLVAETHGVCVRPLAIRRIDTHTGQADVIEVPCGARLASKCKPCAERNRRLRLQQMREGWHLVDEPAVRPDRPGEDVLSMVRTRAHLEFARAEAEREGEWEQLADIDGAIAELDEALSTSSLRGHLTPADRKAEPRRARSTKRRQDTPDLPRLPVSTRTVGRAYAGRDGKAHRPSMLVSLTLGSHGRVHSAARAWRGGMRPCECGQLHGQRDPQLGTPIDPTSYDYRRAALDAIHFARVLDRWWQNLRRAGGWNVQYAGCVELQRRLAPHGHFAIRGTLPRRLLKQVAAATYHQVWWPSFDEAVYTVENPPTWDADAGAYVDPKTGQPLSSWQAALDALDDEDARPAYVARLGTIDARGVAQGTRDAERSIRYVTKYLTKDLTEESQPRSDDQQAHFDRLHAELSTLPCSPTCANWLLYGVQPDGAAAGLVPGRCSGKVHQPRTLGFTGRRVLVSRQWSGKTLADHRADNRAWVRAILAGSVDDDQGDATDPADGVKRYRFELARPGSPGVPSVEHRILRSISARIQWRAQLNAARQRSPGAVPATTGEGGHHGEHGDGG
ncbi:replication initiator [Luedemannella flava]